MSAISQKSISGITSITTPAGVDNVFTVHTNDTTERFRVDSAGSLNIAGISTFSEGIFIPDDKKLSIGNASGNNGDLQLFHTNNNSYVRDFGTGSLLIQGSGVYIQNSNGGTNIASFLENTGVSIPLDLDVDGHTNLDNVSIAGVSTFSNNVHVGTGNILKGLTSARAQFFHSVVNPTVQIEGTGDFDRQVSITSSSSTGSWGAVQILAHQRSNTIGGNTVLQAGDTIGLISYQGHDGTNFIEGSRIESIVGTGVGGNDMPAELRFYTNSGTTSPTERLRITSSGQIGIGTATIRNNRAMQITGESNSLVLITGHAPSICLNRDPDDSSDGDRSFFGVASVSNGFANGTAAGDTVIRGNSSGKIHLATSTSIRLSIASGGDTTFYGSNVSLAIGTLYIPDSLVHNGDNDTKIRFPSNDTITFETAGSERFRIASDGTITTLGTSARSDWITTTLKPSFQIGSGYNPWLSLFKYSNDSYGPYLLLGKTRGTSSTSSTVIQDGDELGNIMFEGTDGSTFRPGARIVANVDGTPGSGDMPTRLSFHTTKDGQNNVSEKLRITSGGNLMLGTTTAAITAGIGMMIANSGGARIKLCDSDLGVDGASGYEMIASNNGTAYLWNRENTHLLFGTNNNERLRITSDGHVFAQSQFTLRGELGMHSSSANAAKYFDIGFQGHSFNMRRTTYGDGGHATFWTCNNSLVMSGDFNDTSDGKLKKNIAAISDGAIEDIKKLRPVTFDWIDDTRNNNVSGFIAQEVKEVLPNLIDGTEYDSTLNDPEKGTKGGIKSQGYSINSVGVTAHLTKALQEAIAKIEVLEAKVAALEGS